MRLVVFNDVHVSARPPASRKSTYTECILRKLREIVAYCNDNAVTHLACTGDWFISKKPESTPHWLQASIYQILSQYQGVFISVIGNHDCDSTLDHFNQSPLYMILEALKAQYRPASGYLLSAWTSEPQPRLIQVAVANYDFGSTVEGIRSVCAQSFLPSAGYPNKVIRMLIMHGPVVPPGYEDRYPSQFLEKAIQAQELVGCADIVFYGDIHDPHGIYKLDEPAYEGFTTTFVNLGALSRNTSKELQNVRPVLIAQYDSGDGSIVEVELEDVDPAEEVFRSEELAYSRQVSNEVGAFVDSLDYSKMSFVILSPSILKERIDGSELSESEKTIGRRIIDTL